MKVEEFYNNISATYTDLLDRAVPKYREMLGTMFHYLPNDFKPLRILELGCGTGNLTEYIITAYPEAQLTVVDISAEMLAECRSRCKTSTTITYFQSDFNDLAFEANSFDLIISSIAIHHLEDSNKQLLFNKLYSFTKPNGIFTYVDQCKGKTDEIYAKHMAAWKREAFKLGSTQENWETWMDHQERHDYHAPPKDQIQWMENAGFNNIDVLWKNLLWTVFYAEKT